MDEIDRDIARRLALADDLRRRLPSPPILARLQTRGVG
jgi:hypothetical protein